MYRLNYFNYQKIFFSNFFLVQTILSSTQIFCKNIIYETHYNDPKHIHLRHHYHHHRHHRKYLDFRLWLLQQGLIQHLVEFLVGSEVESVNARLGDENLLRPRYRWCYTVHHQARYTSMIHLPLPRYLEKRNTWILDAADAWLDCAIYQVFLRLSSLLVNHCSVIIHHWQKLRHWLVVTILYDL